MNPIVPLLILSPFFAVGGFCIFMLIRNQWVFDSRMKVLNSGLREYDRLPSYDVMLNRFWIWDVEKFKTGENK